jgi:hypothetical protein
MHEGRTAKHWRWEGTGSVKNTWFSRGCARKSLIPEASAAMHRYAFAINSSRFAMSSIFAFGRPAPFLSLFKSLREKEKESEEEREMVRIGAPRLGSLCHQLRGLPIFCAMSFTRQNCLTHGN